MPPHAGQRPTPQIEVVGVDHSFRAPWRPWRPGRGRRGAARVVHALQGVGFAVDEGGSLACVGLPGAGKTTLVRLIAGALTPQTGYVRTCGVLPAGRQHQLQGRLGVVAAEGVLWADLRLDEALRTVADLHRLPVGRRQLRHDDLVEQLDLTRLLSRPVGELSPGARTRAEIAAALLPEPAVVVLDGVLEGLDTPSRQRARVLLRHEHRVHGVTLMLTANDLDDADLCRRLLLLEGGRAVFEGTLADLLTRIGDHGTLVVDLRGSTRDLDSVPGADLVEVQDDGRRQRLALRAGSTGAQVLAAVHERAEVRGARLERPRLPEVLAALAAPADQS